MTVAPPTAAPASNPLDHDRRWREPLDANRAAIAEFIARADALSDERWAAPRAAGKWAPSQEVMHVALSHEIFARELRGGPPMQLKLTWPMRTVLRMVLLPRIIRTGKFRENVRAPREIRPAEDPGAADTQRATELPRAAVMHRLRTATADFESALVRAVISGRPRRVTHPFFGGIPLHKALRFATRHTRHHLAHLPETPY